jgi:hypothetical protein
VNHHGLPHLGFGAGSRDPQDLSAGDGDAIWVAAAARDREDLSVDVPGVVAGKERRGRRDHLGIARNRSSLLLRTSDACLRVALSRLGRDRARHARRCAG